MHATLAERDDKLDHELVRRIAGSGVVISRVIMGQKSSANVGQG